MHGCTGDELETRTWLKWYPVSENGTWKSTPRFNMSFGFLTGSFPQNNGLVSMYQKFTFDSTAGYNTLLDMQSMDVIGKITLLSYNDSTIIAEGTCPVDFSVYSNAGAGAGTQISFPTGMRFGGNALLPELSIVNDCRFSRIQVLFPPSQPTWHVSVRGWAAGMHCRRVSGWHNPCLRASPPHCGALLACSARSPEALHADACTPLHLPQRR